MIKNQMIWVTHSFEGFHNFPDAPKEVEYLRNEHRHLFEVKVWIDTKHDNREIEFHMFKKFIKGLITKNKFNHMSCEMISDKMFKKINQEYPFRFVKIEVSEDGECGSYTDYTKNYMRHKDI